MESFVLAHENKYVVFSHHIFFLIALAHVFRLLTNKDLPSELPGDPLH